MSPTNPTDELASYLKVTSEELGPEELTARLGVECDRSWHLGDAISKRRRPKVRRDTHGWVLHSDAEPGPAAEQIRGLTRRLGPGLAQMSTLLGDGRARLQLVLYSHNSRRPHVQLDGVDFALGELEDLLGISLSANESRVGKSAAVAIWTSRVDLDRRREVLAVAGTSPILGRY